MGEIRQTSFFPTGLPLRSEENQVARLRSKPPK